MKKRPVKSNNRLVASKKRRRSTDPATRQLIFQIIGGMGVFGAIVLLLTGVWYGSRVEALTITDITVEGGQTISHTEVKEAVAKTLEGNYFGLIPKRFAWTYPEENVVTAVAGISRVKGPVVERVSGNELKVQIDEYTPFALWCDEDDESKCLFIDKEGVAYTVAPALEGGLMYRFYSLGVTPTIMTRFSEPTLLGNLVSFADALEDRFALAVTKIELDIVGDAYFSIVGGGEIKITTKETPQASLENLALVLSAEEFKDLKAGSFQYIDLRFGNKVFVNDSLPVEDNTTSTASSSVESAVWLEENESDITNLNAMEEEVE